MAMSREFSCGVPLPIRMLSSAASGRLADPLGHVNMYKNISEMCYC